MLSDRNLTAWNSEQQACQS